MIVYSFQYLQDIDDTQNVNIYSLSSLDKLVEDYHKFVKNNFGNLEMFYEDYDNNPDYTYDNYEKAYNDMIQHPKFKILSKSEKYDITEFIPMPLSVEKIISFNLLPGQIKALRDYKDLVLICHNLVENKDTNCNKVFSIQTELQFQKKKYKYSFNNNLYISLDKAGKMFNKQLLNDYKKDREYYYSILKKEIPKFLYYKDAYNFLCNNGFEKEIFKPLSIENIDLKNINNVVFKACHDEFGGYWVSLISHKFIHNLD